MKLRVMLVTEASFLTTGYAVYCRELIKRLHQHPQLDVLELATYCSPDDPRLQAVPWTVYPNAPRKGDKVEEERYNSHPLNTLGAFKFDEACATFMPHVVIDERDWWYMSYQLNCPFRPYFNLLWIPATDSFPQNREWVDNYAQCDAIFNYSDWGVSVLREQGINSLGSLPAIVEESYKPVSNKIQHKAQFGLDKVKIVGTVMRNQKRKLFPDLFEGFRKFLDKTGRTDILLYCHTSYPDNHPWNIPELLNDFALASKVLFTYSCSNCGFAFPAFYSDYSVLCRRCMKPASTTNTQNGVTSQFMAGIFNLFDIYIQYANSEGEGLCQKEAAACGVPLMSVDFSAMSDVVRKLGGIPLKPLSLYRELETGCHRAIPDNNLLANELEKFFNLPDELQIKMGKTCLDNFEKHYNGDMIANRLLSYLSTINIIEAEKRWYTPAKIHNIPPLQEANNLTPSEQANWLFSKVLGKPELLGTFSHARLIRELNYGFTTYKLGDTNDNSQQGHTRGHPLTIQMMYEHFINAVQYRNHCEQARWNKLGKK